MLAGVDDGVKGPGESLTLLDLLGLIIAVTILYGVGYGGSSLSVLGPGCRESPRALLRQHGYRAPSGSGESQGRLPSRSSRHRPLLLRARP